ncbi:MAG: nucleoside permease [Bacteroidia bacterium]|nr:nucleoside permease [Bacteroidia bacterium]
MRSRLSVMMFLNYFTWGAWYVTIGTYMGTELGFTGLQIGSVYASNAIAAIISPFFVGMIADRFFPSQRVLAVLHLIGAALMLGATQVTDFGTFYVLVLLYNLAFMPTIALTNSLSFNQMENPEKQFPAVRLFGTLGWIVVGLGIIGPMKWDPTVYPLMIAAGASLLMGLYSFTLPHTPPKAKGEAISVRAILGLDALALMKKPAFAVVVIASVLICIPLAFYYSFANPFLNEVGFENAAGRMTLGQMSEALFLLVMPFFFARLGVKWMLAIGMGAWALRYLLFAYGDIGGAEWMLLGGIILHGICYDFFFVTGQIFVDKEAPETLKSSAQGMITLATYGIGMFIGSNVSGLIVDAYATGENSHDWTSIWLVPAAFAMGVLLLFLVTFRERKKAKAIA